MSRAQSNALDAQLRGALSPGLDHTRSGASMTTKDGVDPFFTADGMARSGELYLAGQDPNQPLLDDAVRLAERAREAEVDARTTG